MTQQIKNNKKIYWLAIASLFFGIVSWIWAIPFFIAVILGLIYLKKSKENRLRQFKWLAILGIVLGITSVIWWFIQANFIYKSYTL